jgi:hypothetical protein
VRAEPLRHLLESNTHGRAQYTPPL